MSRRTHKSGARELKSLSIAFPGFSHRRHRRSGTRSNKKSTNTKYSKLLELEEEEADEEIAKVLK